jgi:type IV pilus assembly protein PilQ
MILKLKVILYSVLFILSGQIYSVTLQEIKFLPISNTQGQLIFKLDGSISKNAISLKNNLHALTICINQLEFATHINYRFDLPEFIKTLAPHDATCIQLQLLVPVEAQFEVFNHELIVNLNVQNPDSASTTKLQNEQITLDFQDIPIRAVLSQLADFSGQNIVLSDAIKGNVTLKLTDVNWQEAFAIILKTQGLVSRKTGKALYISPTQEIAEKDKQELKLEDDLRNLVPVKTKVYQIKYGKAEQYFDTLKNANNSLLSSRGKAIVNRRTNILFIEDTPEKLRAIDRYIETTDVPVRQVEIEARIMTIDKSYERQLGIRWNIETPAKMASSGNAFNNRFNVDLGGSTTTQSGNGLALATISNDILIGMELAALEAEGGGEILSSPRLLTADQQEALIQQGSEIPYRESTSSGAASIAFKQAVLSLRVTPQITPNDQIMLQLKVNQDARGEEIHGTPLIDTRQISTYVLVANGQTIVLGGIYERSKTKSVVRVPFLGSIPLIGKLFQQQTIKDNRKELLIFVTPRIIKQNMVN